MPTSLFHFEVTQGNLLLIISPQANQLVLNFKGLIQGRPDLGPGTIPAALRSSTVPLQGANGPGLERLKAALKTQQVSQAAFRPNGHGAKS